MFEVFGFLGLGSITDALLGIASIVIAAVVPLFAKKYVGTAKRQAQAAELDIIADGIVAMIRRNNPDNRIVDLADSIQNQVFDQLKAIPTVTNSSTVLRRVVAAAVMRAIDAEGEPVE